jgi:hypothetical protein
MSKMTASQALRQIKDLKGKLSSHREHASGSVFYCVGSLPQVRLIDCQHMALPHVGWAYRPDRTRDDIDEVLVDTLVTTLRIREGSWRPPKG